MNGDFKITTICVYPDNPHYYMYNGQPIILITSAHHYGAVINLDFNYPAYLDTLKAKDMNYERIYPGAMFGIFNFDDPLGPEEGGLILPWARSSTPGYALGGNKFNLDRWDPAYFTRLKDFITKARDRGIIVEICFFNCQYHYKWANQALYYANNIQGTGTCGYLDFQTLKDTALVARQEAYVRKITREVNGFDNVILEICDEPGCRGTPESEYGPWISRMIDVIRSTESSLPNKHLIAQQVYGTIGGPGDFSEDARVPVIVGQYVGAIRMPSGAIEYGGIYLLDTEYGHNKPIELNETLKYPYWVTADDKISSARAEAWEFIVGGGAAYTQNNALYKVNDPTGGTETAVLCTALKNLKDFMYSFNFVKMYRDTSLITGGVPPGAFARGISEPGKQYALYIHHSVLSEGQSGYIAKPGTYTEDLSLNIAAGTYNAEWIDPAAGRIIHTGNFTHGGGNRIFTMPRYSIDIALRIRHQK
jgi:hypothetical protein